MITSAVEGQIESSDYKSCAACWFKNHPRCITRFWKISQLQTAVAFLKQSFTFVNPRQASDTGTTGGNPPIVTVPECESDFWNQVRLAKLGRKSFSNDRFRSEIKNFSLFAKATTFFFRKNLSFWRLILYPTPLVKKGFLQVFAKLQSSSYFNVIFLLSKKSVSSISPPALAGCQ